MIYQRKTLAAINASSATIFIVLVAITLSVISVRVLKDAALGNINQNWVPIYLVLAFFSVSPYIMQITTSLSVLQVFQRFYADSEMVIWESAGLPLYRWLKVVGKVLMPLTLLVLVLVLFVRPWSLEMRNRLNTQFKQSQAVVSPSPGNFNPLAEGLGVMYIEDEIGLNQALAQGAGDALLQKIFFIREMPSAIGTGKQWQMGIASRGKIANDQSNQIQLHQGHLYTLNPPTATIQALAFDRLTMNALNPYFGDSERIQSMSTLRLLPSKIPAEQGELFFRLSVIVQMLVLVCYALAFAYSPPRTRQYLNMVLLLCVGLVYYNLTNIFQSLIHAQRIHWGVAMVLLHGTMLAVGVLLMLSRAYRFSWRRARPYLWLQSS